MLTIERLERLANSNGTIFLDTTNPELALLVAKNIHALSKKTTPFFHIRENPTKTQLVNILTKASGSTIYIENVFPYSKDLQETLLHLLNSHAYQQVITSCGKHNLDELYDKVQHEKFSEILYYTLSSFRLHVSSHPQVEERAFLEINKFLLKEKILNI